MKKELIIGLLVMVLLISGCTSAPTTKPQPRQTHPIIQPTETRAAESSPMTTPLTISILLGTPRQLFHENQPDALGMKGVPDQPLTPIQQPDKSYRLFIAGGEIGGIRGSTGLISTKNFLTYTPLVGNRTETQPVLTPSCRGDSGALACRDNYDAEYAGVDLVFPSSNGKDLLMHYQGVSKNFGTTYSDNAFYSVVALATSADNGVTWTRKGPIISGSDPKPTSNPKQGAMTSLGRSLPMATSTISIRTSRAVLLKDRPFRLHERP
jgi:hypothetical protein